MSGPKQFSPVFRLRRRWEYLGLRERGEKRHTSHFIVFFLEKACGPSRLGVTVSRKVGGAVVRNRVKRLLREFFRGHRCRLGRQIDLSIIAKRGAGDLDYDGVCRELNFLVEDPGPRNTCLENRSLP